MDFLKLYPDFVFDSLLLGLSRRNTHLNTALRFSHRKCVSASASTLMHHNRIMFSHNKNYIIMDLVSTEDRGLWETLHLNRPL